MIITDHYINTCNIIESMTDAVALVNDLEKTLILKHLVEQVRFNLNKEVCIQNCFKKARFNLSNLKEYVSKYMHSFKKFFKMKF